MHPYPGGAFLTITAPADVLYTATELNEAGWSLAHPEVMPEIAPVLADLRDTAAQEADPPALTLYEHARKAGFSAYLDEAGVSVGMGCRSRTWEPGKAPVPGAVDWGEVGDIPVALVTGTNGKTTTSRLLTALLKGGGRCCGLTSTDAIEVDGEVLESGDFSGPAGARRVLRDRRVEAAVLETARGGLLRRGLAVERASVAVVTNIAADHLGDGGIETLEDLARLKLLVLRALSPGGVAVLNADDPRCRAAACPAGVERFWFTLDPARAAGLDPVAWADNGILWVRRQGAAEALGPLADFPITIGGAARHNVANVLAAVAAAVALDAPLAGLAPTLQAFGGRPEDNPGRSMLLELHGRRALVDFGHNPDGVSAILETARSLCDGRIIVVFGQAGDRSDEAIRELTRTIHDGGARLFVIKEMAEYRRGRAPGEVAAVILDELRGLGVQPKRMIRAETEEQAALMALSLSRPGDLLVLFVHAERERVVAALHGGGGS